MPMAEKIRTALIKRNMNLKELSSRPRKVTFAPKNDGLGFSEAVLFCEGSCYLTGSIFILMPPSSWIS